MSASPSSANVSSVALKPATTELWLVVDSYTLKQALQAEPLKPKTLYEAWKAEIGQRLLASGGRLLKFHQNLMFAAFQDELSLTDAIDSAISFAQSLNHTPLTLGQQALPVRAGLALKTPESQTELLTATERQLAPKQYLVVHEAIVQLIGRKRYPLVPVTQLPELPQGFDEERAKPYYYLPLAAQQPEQPFIKQPLASPAKPTNESERPQPEKPAPEEEDEVESRLEHFIAESARQTELNETLPPQPVSTEDDGFNSYQAGGFQEQLETPPVTKPVTAPAERPGSHPAAEEATTLTTPVHEVVSTELPSPSLDEAPENKLVEETAPPYPAPVVQQPTAQPSTGGLRHLPANEDYLQAALNQQWPLPNVPEPPIWLTEDVAQPVGSVQQLPYYEAVQWLQQDLESFCRTAQSEADTGQLRVVQAPSGFGKSSILTMVRNSFEPLPTEEGEEAPPPPPYVWLNGSAWNAKLTPYPLQLWVDVFRNLFGFPPDAMATEPCTQHIEQVLQQLYGETLPEAVHGFFIRLMSLAPVAPLSPQFENSLGTHVPILLDFINRAAQFKPLVLVLEDVDQADVGSLELLQALLGNGLLQLPVYVVLTTTPDAQPTSALLPAELAERIEQVQLEPFTLETASAFLNAGPMNGQLERYPQAFVQRLIQRSQGLPLWLEETIRYLTLKGSLTFDAAANALVPKNKEALASLELPDSPYQVLEQRGLALDDGHRFVLQAASILGDRFSIEALSALSQIEVEPLQESLQQLWEQGWIMPEVGNSVAFRHTLLRQFWLESIGPDQRRGWHQRIYQFYQEQSSKAGISMAAARLAHHAIEAEDAEGSFHCLNTAAVWATQLGCLHGAGQTFAQAQRALQEVEAFPQKPMTLQVLAETTARLYLSVAPAYSEQALLSLLKPVAEARDTGHLVYLLQTLATALEQQGELPLALKPIESAREVLPKSEEWQAVYWHLSETRLNQLVDLGAYGLLRKEWQQLKLEQETQHGLNPLAYNRFKGLLLLREGYPKQAQALLEETLQAQKGNDQPSDDPVALIRCLLALGQLAKEQQLFKLLEGILNHTLNLLNDEASVHHRFYAEWGLLAIEAHLLRGDTEAAAPLLGKVQEEMAQSAWPVGALRLLIAQGHLLCLLKQPNEGLLLLRQALEHSQKLGHTSLSLNIQLLLMRFDPLRSAELAEAASRLMQAPELVNEQLKLEAQLANITLLLNQQAYQDAEALLRPLWEQNLRQQPTYPLRAEGAFAIAQLFAGKAGQAQEPGQQLKLYGQAKAFAERALALWQHLENPAEQDKVKAFIKRISPTA